MLTGVGTGVGLALKAGNMAAKTGKVAKTASTLQKINTARGLKYGRASESYYDNALKVAQNLANAPHSKGLEKAVARGNDLVEKSIWADGAANNYSNAKWAIETGLGSGIGSKTGKLFNKN